MLTFFNHLIDLFIAENQGDGAGLAIRQFLSISAEFEIRLRLLVELPNCKPGTIQHAGYLDKKIDVVGQQAMSRFSARLIAILASWCDTST